MWIIGLLVLGTMIGGPIGFIIALVIIGMMIVGKESENTSSNQQQSTNQQTSEHSSAQHDYSMIEQLAPCIDIVCHFALKYESNWTSEKVRYVKGRFEHLCKTNQDHAFLKERLKTGYRASLETNTHRWLKLEPTFEDRDAIFYTICILLFNTYHDIETIKQDCFKFGTSIGLTYEHCYNEISQIIAKQQQHSQQEESYQQQDRHQTKSRLEQAAETLGVSINATSAEIQKAYRLKIKDYHPDRNPNVTPAVQKMLEEQSHALNDARDIMLASAK